VKAKLYPQKLGDSKYGDCVELSDGTRWIVLPRNVMACIGHRKAGTKFKPEIRTINENESCRIYGDAAEVFAEISTHEIIRKSAGLKVVFVYDCGGHRVTHAVLDSNRNGIGFCGAVPSNSSYCSRPDGGLCYICSEYVTQNEKGEYVVKAKPKFQSFGYHEIEAANSDSDYYDDD
jgi:hypothetical protein